jgi:hypothetical protein
MQSSEQLLNINFKIIKRQLFAGESHHDVKITVPYMLQNK